MGADVDRSPRLPRHPRGDPAPRPALRAGGARSGDGRLHDRHDRVRDDGAVAPDRRRGRRLHPAGRAHHLRVRRGRGHRRPGAGLLRRPPAAARAAGCADGRLRGGQRGQRARHVVRAAHAGQGGHGLPPRRLLRRRVPGGGLARAPGPQGAGRRHGDAGSVGRQRDRRARGHLAGPAPRLALGLLGGHRDSLCSRPPSSSSSCPRAPATPRPPGGASCARSASRRCG